MTQEQINKLTNLITEKYWEYQFLIGLPFVDVVNPDTIPIYLMHKEGNSFIILWYYPKENRIHLADLFTKYRRKRLGHKIMTTAINICKELNIRHITLYVKPDAPTWLHEWYKRDFGFELLQIFLDIDTMYIKKLS